MASAYELHDSRVGTVRGVFGMPRAFTRWRVTTDSVNDDPVLTLDDYVPLGAEHPYGGSYALEYYELQRMTDTEYLYEVSYGPPLYIPGVDWTITIDTALETETVLIDHRGNPIGPHQYITVGTYDELPTDQRPPSVNTGVKYRTATPEGKYLLLYQLGAESDRRAVGLERTKPVQQVFFDITVTIVSPNADVVSETYVNTVNSGTFRGRKAGTVKCLGTTIVQRAGVIAEGQPVTGRVFDVRVAFAVSQDGWQPIKIVDTYRHQDGSESFIKNALDGTSVTTNYYPYGTSDFERLLQLFAAPTRRITAR